MPIAPDHELAPYLDALKEVQRHAQMVAECPGDAPRRRALAAALRHVEALDAFRGPISDPPDID